MKWPLVRRSKFERLEEALERLQHDAANQRRALARIGHERDRAYREVGQLVSDLRLVRFHFENQRQRAGRVSVVIELTDEMLYHTYRRDRNFREVVGWMLEEAFVREYGAGAPYGIFRNDPPSLLDETVALP